MNPRDWPTLNRETLEAIAALGRNRRTLPLTAGERARFVAYTAGVGAYRLPVRRGFGTWRSTPDTR